jgi:hypothetical protein
MVHEQRLKACAAGAGKVGLRLIADVHNLIGGDAEPPDSDLKDSRRRFSDSDFAGDDQMLEEMPNIQLGKNIVEAAIEIRNYPETYA